MIYVAIMNTVCIKVSGLMNYNTDGFNERSIYIHNSNDRNNLKKSYSDTSFAQMKIQENKSDITTVNHDKNIVLNDDVRGSMENFVLRTSKMRNLNTELRVNNPVREALNKNMFKK